ncbi:MAG: hypothetical protein IT428_12380 [Planctomycetaceae bacterium]|nr:hypothetical protein [Planctomycetaceae bacterium]
MLKIMATALDSITEAEIFSRVIGGDDSLPISVARSVLTWKFPKRDLTRVGKLQEKNNAGTITAEERDELERYVRVSQFLSVLQARARLTLKSRGEA